MNNPAYTLMVKRNKDLSYTAKVRLNNKRWWQRKVYGIYYALDWMRPIEHHNDDYYIRIPKHEGETTKYFMYIIQMFIDFKRQYNINEKCKVVIIK